MHPKSEAVELPCIPGTACCATRESKVDTNLLFCTFATPAFSPCGFVGYQNHELPHFRSQICSLTLSPLFR